MKKTALFFCAALLALVSCNKEIIDTPAGHEPAAEITFELSATHPDGDGTKAVKTGWETGDVIFVFFQEFDAPKYLKMTYNGTDWTKTQMNGSVEESLGLSIGQVVHMRAVYLPFGSGLTVSADGRNFVFSETQESYYLTATLDCTVEGGTVKGNFAMKIPDGYVQFFCNLPEGFALYKDIAAVELREPQLTPQGIAAIGADGTIRHTPVVHGAPLKGYLYDKEVKTGSEAEGYLFSGILASDARNAAMPYCFTIYLKLTLRPDWTVEAYYQKKYADNTLYTGNTKRRALLLPGWSSWSEIVDYKPIDLGCDIDLGGGEKRRVYWSSRNLRATSETGYGDYVAWGELTGSLSGKNNFNWPAYSFDSNGYGNKFTKYTGSDYAVLQKEDDAARAVTDGKFRMPTQAEFEALLALPNEWVTDYNSTDFNGWKFTGNGNTLFLPAAGFQDIWGLQHKGGGGYYWSSSLDTESPAKAVCLSFDMSDATTSSGERCLGYSIRPVMD